MTLAPLRRLLAALAAFVLLLVAGQAIALADNIVADGDGLTPVNTNNLVFGNVTCGATTSMDVALAISRNGNSGPQVFGSSAVVTITVTGVTGAGLSATAPSASISMPSNWQGLANNTMSSLVLSSVSLISTTPGAGTGTVTYTATGVGAGGGTVTRDATLPVTWTTGTCVTPSAVTVSCPPSVTYTGSALAPCTATATGSGLNVSVPVTYTANVNSGTATASATFAGDAMHTGSTGSATFAIAKATTVVQVTCPPSAVYTGLALTPCSASATGAGALNQPLTVAYTDNTAVGSAHASASFVGDANHVPASDATTFGITKAGSTVTVTCDPMSVEYDGSPRVPCTAVANGVGLGSPVDLTSSIVYTDNVAAGTANASASWGGDANHSGSTNSTSFAITQASSVVVVDCSAASETYDTSAHEPCIARVTGVGGLDQALTVSYTDNVNAGIATASATFTGDSNHTGATAGATFLIAKAPSSVDVTCSPTTVTYIGAPQTPCSATVTGVGGLSQALTPTYTNNINAGTATASATFAGDDNHLGSSDDTPFTIAKAASTIELTCPAEVVYTGSALEPCTATVSGDGTMEALPVSIAYTGNTGVGIASVSATWPGDANHLNSADYGSFKVTKAPSTVSVSCPASVVYTGSPLTPCTATVSGAGLDPNAPPTVAVQYAYTNNTVAGTASLTAIWDGDPNHTGDTDATTFVIDKAPSSVSVICSVSSVTYTGGPQTPCTASVTGAGGLSGTLPVAYADNVAAGTATASAHYAGDDNHLASNGQATFTIAKASSTVTVTCPASVVFTGSAQTPCTAMVTGAGGLNQAVSPVTYSGNTAVGTATALASYASEANHLGSTGSATFQILAWTLKGYYQPVDMNTATTTVWNTVKNGSTVPLKFEAFVGSSEIVTTALLQATFTVTGVNCPGSNAVTDDIELTTTGGTAFRYDTSAGQFIQSWQTPKKAGACYTVTTTTMDGSKLSAWFVLK